MAETVDDEVYQKQLLIWRKEIEAHILICEHAQTSARKSIEVLNQIIDLNAQQIELYQKQLSNI